MIQGVKEKEWYILIKEQLPKVGLKERKGFYRMCRGRRGRPDKGNHVGHGHKVWVVSPLPSMAWEEVSEEEQKEMWFDG